MKTKEELNALKAEVETLNKKLAELTDEELKQVAGGDYFAPGECPYCGGALEPFQWATDPFVYQCIDCRKLIYAQEPVY